MNRVAIPIGTISHISSENRVYPCKYFHLIGNSIHLIGKYKYVYLNYSRNIKDMHMCSLTDFDTIELILKICIFYYLEIKIFMRNLKIYHSKVVSKNM